MNQPVTGSKNALAGRLANPAPGGFLSRSLSHDLPGGRLLGGLLILILAGLVAAPFLFSGAKALAVASKIVVFALLVGSYDLLLGFTGIVSFAHTMFFGLGAYGVAIASTQLGGSWLALLAGVSAALVLSLLLSLAIGLFSLRVKAIFYAMITLAVASAFQTLASQLSAITGGEDGLSFRVPELFSPSFRLFEGRVLGVAIDGRLLTYYAILAVATGVFLGLLRVVNSPFGRVLQAIRENDFRAEAIGYRPVVFRTLSNMLSAACATIAGALLAVSLRYNGPETTLSFEVMLDILLIVVIGGMGTLYGALVGATLFLIAQNYLQQGLGWLAEQAGHVPLVSGVLGALLSPDRWLLWLGLLFVLCVYFFPAGLVGKLRRPGLRTPAP